MYHIYTKLEAPIAKKLQTIDIVKWHKTGGNTEVELLPLKMTLNPHSNPQPNPRPHSTPYTLTLNLTLTPNNQLECHKGMKGVWRGKD
jgi:hypothetical protein